MDDFDLHTPLPIIIGVGVTGMAISCTLSAKGIKHLLIGRVADPNIPKLGESLNLEATLDIIDFYPEFLEYCTPKKALVYYRANKAVYLPLDAGSYTSLIYLLKSFGYNTPNYVIHVDRYAFDNALFQKCTKSEHCIFIDDIVADLSYDQASDRVTEIKLSNGLALKSQFVFDATNHVRLVAKKLNIPGRYLGKKQHVLFSHYHRSTTDRYEPTKWQESTNLVSLEKEIDNIDGVAWCIPLKNYLSIGISIKDNGHNLSDKEIMSLVDKAFTRRGIDYSDYNQRDAKLVSIRGQQYFSYERGYGANWVLAGGSYTQTWFLNGAGVSTGLYVACLADQFLQSPTKTGEKYTEYIEAFLLSHQIVDKLLSDDFHIMTEKELARLVGDLLLGSLIRLSLYAQSRNSRTNAFFAAMAEYTFRKKLFFLNPILENFSKIIETDLSDQTRQIHIFAEEKLKFWRDRPT